MHETIIAYSSDKLKVAIQIALVEIRNVVRIYTKVDVVLSSYKLNRNQLSPLVSLAPIYLKTLRWHTQNTSQDLLNCSKNVST